MITEITDKIEHLLTTTSDGELRWALTLVMNEMATRHIAHQKRKQRSFRKEQKKPSKRTGATSGKNRAKEPHLAG